MLSKYEELCKKMSSSSVVGHLELQVWVFCSDLLIDRFGTSYGVTFDPAGTIATSVQDMWGRQVILYLASKIVYQLFVSICYNCTKRTSSLISMTCDNQVD